MKKILTIIILSVILFSGCGKKGPPVYKEKSEVIYKQS